jgi:hypothetical protein
LSGSALRQDVTEEFEFERQRTRPSTDAIVSLGSEIFAKLLLSGASGIAAVEKLADRDFPHIASLSRSDGSHLEDRYAFALEMRPSS